jgi:hypothetical protein
VSKTTIHEAVTEKLGYRKSCARWVPKMLTDGHQTKRMGSALTFLTLYAQEGNELLGTVVTGDETWGFTTLLNRSKSLEWQHTHAFPYDGTHRAFGGTLDRRCHFKHVSLKHSPILPQTNEHGSQVKDQGRRQCCHTKNKKFPYRPILSGHGNIVATSNRRGNINSKNVSFAKGSS